MCAEQLAAELGREVLAISAGDRPGARSPVARHCSQRSTNKPAGRSSARRRRADRLGVVSAAIGNVHIPWHVKPIRRSWPSISATAASSWRHSTVSWRQRCRSPCIRRPSVSTGPRAELAPFIEPLDRPWAIASVHRPAAERLIAWLTVRGVGRIQLLTLADLPLAVDVDEPLAVGLDRLGQRRGRQSPPHGRSDGDRRRFRAAQSRSKLFRSAGAFIGGAILPGLAMSARALHQFTDLLPQIDVPQPPHPLGKTTVEAISSRPVLGGSRRRSRIGHPIDRRHPLGSRYSSAAASTQLCLVAGRRPPLDCRIRPASHTLRRRPAAPGMPWPAQSRP